MCSICIEDKNMYNKTKLLALTTTILMLATIASMGYFTPAEARHGNLDTFASGSIQYTCYGNLSLLRTDETNPCTQFGKAAQTWSNEVSKIGITTSNNTQKVDVSSADLSNTVIAVMQPVSHKDGEDLVKVQIKFNTDKKWGEHKKWQERGWRMDTETVALHEIGHMLSLAHDASSSLMKPRMSTWDYQVTIPTHDSQVVKRAFR